MEHFFLRIQVEIYAQMLTRVKLLGGCRCKPYSNYWGAYSQINGGIYPPWVSAPLPATPLNQFLPANLNKKVEEMIVFVQKVAISGSHLAFL